MSLAQDGVRGEVLGSQRGSIELEDSPAVQDAVNDRVGEVIVVQHRTPTSRVLVGGEDHRASLDVTLVDDVEEDVRGVVPVGQVADLVDDEDVRTHVHRERLAQSTLAARA